MHHTLKQVNGKCRSSCKLFYQSLGHPRDDNTVRSLFMPRLRSRKMLCKLKSIKMNTKLPFKTVLFPGVKRLTSSYYKCMTTPPADIQNCRIYRMQKNSMPKLCEVTAGPKQRYNVQQLHVRHASLQCHGPS